MVTRILSAALIVLTACGRSADEHGAATNGEPSRAAVPGVESTVAVREAVRDVVRAPAAVTGAAEPAEVRDARAQLAEAEARRRLAAQQVRRLEPLAGSIAPRKELEAARAEEAAAAAAAARARQVLAAFGTDEAGQVLAPDETWVIARALQLDMPRVAAGSDAELTPDALPEETFQGRVDAAPAYVDPGTQTAPVRVRVRDPEQRLRPGMTGAVLIEVGAPRDAVVVPTAAVVYDGAQPVVFVQSEGESWTPRPVRLGVVRDGRAEVVDGLEVGARVATTGAASLLSAMRLPAEAD